MHGMRRQSVGGITAAIAGSRSERHTRDNAGGARLALSPTILDRIEELIPLGPAAPTPA
jgi:aryl-alcohol dehydrogenase-like predicted oxidoreductase